MASDIPPSVYLNAARAYDLAVDELLGNPPPRTSVLPAETLARHPAFRAFAESVWDERGRHDAEAIRALHAEPHECPEWDAGHGWVTGFFAGGECPTLAALDAQRPAEGGPEKLTEEPENGRVYDRLGREWRWSAAGEFWCYLTEENLRHTHRPWRELVAEFGPLTAAPAALDSGQPATGETPEDAACPHCGPGYRFGDEGCRHSPATRVIDKAELDGTDFDGNPRFRVTEAHWEPAPATGATP